MGEKYEWPLKCPKYLLKRKEKRKEKRGTLSEEFLFQGGEKIEILKFSNV